MISPLRSGYLTMAALEDDGTGQIDCPRKGSIMAIQRCQQWQAETAATGAACTCATFTAHQAAAAARCGRQIEASPTKHAPCDACGQPPWLCNCPDDDEEATMPRNAKRCTKCNNLSPGFSRVRDGVCKPCRDKQTKTDPAPKKSGARADKIRDRAEAKKPPVKAPADDNQAVTKPAPVTTTQVPTFARQQILPPVAEIEIADLRSVNEKLARDLEEMKRNFEKIHWIVDGITRGFATIDQLMRAMKGAA
jgi:hypothetical protein